MAKWLAILVLIGGMGVVSWRGLDHAPDPFWSPTPPAAGEPLREEVLGLREHVLRLSTRLEAEREAAGRWRRMAERLEGTEAALAGLESRLVELDREDEDPPAIEAHLAELEAGVRSRVESAYDLASSAAALAGENRQVAELLVDRLEPRHEPRVKWEELVGPVVQLAGSSSVGSGVLLPAGEVEGEPFRPVLTAWHVIRDIQGEDGDRTAPIPVSIYDEDGDVIDVLSELVAWDADLDVALLRLESGAPHARGARMPSRTSAAAVRTFAPIYAVGCPLGNSPIPTPGEVATANHRVEGETYLMINAPTYVGNSGGGIFDARTHELLGVFSKVYTHGAMRPTIVTHMGLVTPLSVVYDWLERSGFGELVPGSTRTAGAPGKPADRS
jgi:hypothetical protein